MPVLGQQPGGIELVLDQLFARIAAMRQRFKVECHDIARHEADNLAAMRAQHFNLRRTKRPRSQFDHHIAMRSSIHNPPHGQAIAIRNRMRLDITNQPHFADDRQTLEEKCEINDILAKSVGP